MSESRALRPKCASYSHTWNDKRGEKIFIAVIYDLATRSVQRWAETWALSCVNPAPWLPLAAGREFTQPRARLIAQLCTSGFLGDLEGVSSSTRHENPVFVPQ